MKHYRFVRLFQFLTPCGVLTLVLLALLPAIASHPAQAQTEIVLYSFCPLPGTCPDGASPLSRLIADGAGNLYGTATNGGGAVDGAYGVVFELSPNGDGGWTQTVIHSFTGGDDGEDPTFSPLILDGKGNLYGTTWGGGAHGEGLVFEFSPVGDSWTETELYSFCALPGCADGAYPTTGVIMDSAGNLFGETSGSYGGGDTGVVFELSPSHGERAEQVIYTFENLSTYPQNTGVTMDANGNIFGLGSSIVFELSPDGSGGWTPSVIHTFTGYPKDGDTPQGVLVTDQAGNLYGVTSLGGTNNNGTAYKLSPVTKGKNKATWKEQILHSFVGGKTGSNPFSALVFDAAGNLYGTTFYGGKFSDGTIFALAAQLGKSSYTGKTLWSFNYTDGDQPVGSLIVDLAGNLLGTTSTGGLVGAGTVFEVNPSPTSTNTSLTSTPNPSAQGQAVTFTAVVAPAPPDGETVSFMKGKTVLGTGTLSGGSATFTTSTLKVGNSSVEVVYGGDLDFAGSTSKPLKQVVEKAELTTSRSLTRHDGDYPRLPSFQSEPAPDRCPLCRLLCWRERDQSDANNNEGRNVAHQMSAFTCILECLYGHNRGMN
jgi:uncharacterized repeat protein (TIGR03803 family)